MNSTHLPAIVDNPSHRRGPGQMFRRHLTGRRGIMAVAVAAVVAGLALNWSWLVAAGIAPVLISVLPCAAMCALGLCMNKTARRKCSAEGASSTDTPAVMESVSPTLPDGHAADSSRGQ